MSRPTPRPVQLAALLALLFASAAGLLAAPQRALAAAPLTAGNLVVLRVGDGSAALSSAATAVFLDEYAPTGALQQTIPMPTASSGANARLTTSGSATSEGALARSADGRFLTLAGYDAATGTASVVGTASAAVNRVVARVAADGTVDTTTRILDGYTGNNIRGAVTSDGSGFWTGGTASGTAGGVRFVPFGNTAATTTQITNPPTNVRAPNIFGGQLFVSSGSSPNIGVNQVGTGLPTGGLQSAALLPGLPNTGNPYAFLLLDRDAGVAGLDTLYIADQTSSVGLAKYSFDGATWTARGNVTGVLTGLAGQVSGGSAVLYATLGTGAGNALVTFTDAAAFNAPISAGSFTTLATAPANTAFRGVAFAPADSTPPPPAAPSITAQPQGQSVASGQTATLSVTATGTAPLAYQWYQGPSGDTSSPVGANSSSFTTPPLTADASYWVRVSNAAGSADSAAAAVTVLPAGPGVTKISAVQGSGPVAALSGQTVTVEAVVVGDYQGQGGAELRGFFLQEEDADADGDPATSEGIFVFCGTCATAVSVGDRVQVTGSVSEFFDMTQITSTSVTVLGSGSQLPTPATVALPVPSGVTVNAYYEQFEGMLVRFPDTLSVSEYFELARYGQIELSQGGRPRQLTDLSAPSAAGYAAHLDSLARRTIILDDLNNTQNFAITGSDTPYYWPRPGLSAANYLRGGDTIAGLTGVLHWSFAGQTGTDAWRVRPVEPAFSYTFTRANPRPAAPAIPGALKVGAYNVLNFFLTPDTTSSSSAGPCGATQTLDCRGPDSAAESAQQRAKLTQALKSIDADALGLIELENTPGVDPLAAIVGDLNAATAPGTYAAISTGVIGGDAIRVGIIYKPGRLTPIGAYKTLDKTVDPRFNSDIMRPSLAQTFLVNATGAKFTLVVNHLKSKGSCPASGPDADQLDGQGCWNATRASAAQAVADWIKADPTGSGDPDFLVVGDMNAYRNEDPIAAFRQAGLVDLIDTRIGAGAYSYLFDGQLGYLDHALATPSLAAQVAGVDEWHINADESDLLDYNDAVRDTPGESAFERKSAALPLYEASPYRTSDHDPVLVGMNLAVANTPPALAAVATYDTGLGGSGAEIVSVRGDRAVVSNAPDASVDIVDVSDLLAPRLVKRIKLPELTGLTSVAIHPSKDLFVAVAGDSTPTSRFGRLLVFRLSDGALLAQATVAPAADSPDGRQPDSVEFSPDGAFAVVAVEAQQVNATNDGGAGAIAVASFAAFDPATSTSVAVATVELPDLTGLPGASSGRGYDTDLTPRTLVVNTPGGLEPEGIAFAADSSAAYVTLQENNIVVRLDLAGPLPATLPAASAFGLGQTTHAADVTVDGAYSPTGSVTLFREPDGIRAVEIGGVRYLVTADEGDTRLGTSSSVRGGRTVTIIDAATGAVVADTAGQLDDLASRYGIYPDSRSNRGGSEPEMLDVKVFGGRVIAAVGLERANAVAFVDISVPTAPLAFGLIRTGDAPEGVKLVERGGVLYALTANEASGTVTIATAPVSPLAAAVAYTEDTPRAFGLAAVDADGDTLTVDLTLTPASAGALSGAGLTDLGGGQYRVSGSTAAVSAALRALTFTPAPNGSAAATIAISASDGVNPPAAGTVTLVGTEVNDLPTAADDAYAIDNNTTLSVPAPGVLGNDADADDPLAAAAVGALPAGVTLGADGSLTYTPATDFAGLVTFQYTASDGRGGSATATVRITVRDTVAPVTAASVAGAPRAGCPSDCLVGSATVTLSASDGGSGVASTEYRVRAPFAAGFGAWQPYAGPFAIADEGASAVEFRSADAAGNVEAAKSVTVKVTNVRTTAVLDSFGRRDGALGSSWGGDVGGYSIRSSQVQVFGGGPIYWRAGGDFGTSQEAFVTLTSVDPSAPEQDLLLKVQGGTSPSWTKGAIEVLYNAKAGTVRVETYRPTAGWTLYATIPAVFQSGDQLGARALASGDVLIYKNCLLIGRVTLGSADQAFFNGKGGRIGLWFISAPAARFDDFGGGTVAP